MGLELREPLRDLLKDRCASSASRSDAIFIDELRAAGCYDRVSHAFAVFLPVKSAA